jgi:pentapeptide repeat protein
MRPSAANWRTVGLGVAAVVGFVAIAYFVLKLAPDWFADTNGLDAKGRDDARQGVRTASLALLARTVGVVGAVYTARSFALNRAGQLTDRFTQAIEQLGHKELDVRLGGIYALERIARDSKEDHPQVMEVPTAYVREHAPKSDGGTQEAQAAGENADALEGNKSKTPATDVQAVLTVLGRRTLAHEQGAEPVLDLRFTDLRGANFFEAELQRVNLGEADLSEAGSTGRTSKGHPSSRRTSAGRASGRRISKRHSWSSEPPRPTSARGTGCPVTAGRATTRRRGSGGGTRSWPGGQPSGSGRSRPCGQPDSRPGGERPNPPSSTSPTPIAPRLRGPLSCPGRRASPG